MNSPHNPPALSGSIAAVVGNVVDARFDAALPRRDNLLLAGRTEPVALEVQSHLDAHTVRCIALNATAGLALGDAYGATTVGIGQRRQIVAGGINFIEHV